MSDNNRRPKKGRAQRQVRGWCGTERKLSVAQVLELRKKERGNMISSGRGKGKKEWESIAIVNYM